MDEGPGSPPLDLGASDGLSGASRPARKAGARIVDRGSRERGRERVRVRLAGRRRACRGPLTLTPFAHAARSPLVATATAHAHAHSSRPVPAIGAKRPQVDHPLPPGEGRGEGTALHVEACCGRGHSTWVTSASGSQEVCPRITNGHFIPPLIRLTPMPVPAPSSRPFPRGKP